MVMLLEGRHLLFFLSSKKLLDLSSLLQIETQLQCKCVPICNNLGRSCIANASQFIIIYYNLGRNCIANAFQFVIKKIWLPQLSSVNYENFKATVTQSILFRCQERYPWVTSVVLCISSDIADNL